MELIVSVTIVSILAVLALVALDPFRQLNKAKDSDRLSDITKIRNSSDIYYDDQSCYPASMPFGAKLQSPDKSVTYLNPVPQDPNYSHDSTQRYLYETDGSDCPQWNVLFARITVLESQAASTCPLELMNNCLPPNFDHSGYNYCVVSGNVNCSFIASNVLSGLPTNYVSPTPKPSFSFPSSTPGQGGSNSGSGPSPSINPQATPTPQPSLGPTPTPTPGPPIDPNCSPKNYVCSNGRCNVVATGTGVYCTNNCDGWCQ